MSAAFFNHQLVCLPACKVAPPNAKRRFAVAFGTLAPASVPTELRADMLFAVLSANVSSKTRFEFCLLRFGISLTQQSQGMCPEN